MLKHKGKDKLHVEECGNLELYSMTVELTLPVYHMVLTCSVTCVSSVINSVCVQSH